MCEQLRCSEHAARSAQLETAPGLLRQYRKVSAQARLPHTTVVLLRKAVKAELWWLQ